MKRDRRDGAGRPCLKPAIQSAGEVRLARIAAGLEQRQVAAQAGISPGYMSEIERGTRSVKPPVLAAIAAACGCEFGTLLNPELDPAMRSALIKAASANSAGNRNGAAA